MNELQREARQKLFSYAVAALSNFFWDSLRISQELSIMGRLASPIGPLLCVGERVRTHSDTGRSHKVIGIGSSRQWSRNGPKCLVARDCRGMLSGIAAPSLKALWTLTLLQGIGGLYPGPNRSGKDL